MVIGRDAPYMYNSKKATTFLRELVGDAEGTGDGAAVGASVYFLGEEKKSNSFDKIQPCIEMRRRLHW